MVRHFAQANEFNLNLVRDEDIIVAGSHVSVENHLGGYNEIRPPAGYYLSLASGPEIVEEPPSAAPLPVKWKPQE
eukprot:11805535-Alexandrium_andersonii.AAC.1